jgi:hypothetical protein
MKKVFVFILLCFVLNVQVISGEIRKSTNDLNRTNNVPNLIDFNGRLTDSSGNAVDQTVNITFKLYDAESGGTALWTETQTVNVTDGLFNVQLGSVTTLNESNFSSSERWIGISVGTDSEMTPRTRIAAVPYALQSGTSTPDEDWTIDGDDIYHETGNVGIGTTFPDTDLTVYSDVDQQGLTLRISDNSYRQGLRFRNSGQSYTWNIYRKNAGSNKADLVFANGKDSDINNLTENVTFQNGGNVGIGTDTPDEKLSVVGKIRASNDADEAEYVELNHGGSNANINWNGDGDLNFRYNNSTLATLKQSGDFNIPFTQGYQIGGDTVLHENGGYSIFLGKFAGQNITTGQANTFVGQLSGANNTEGNYNSFFGFKAGQNNTTGLANTFIGEEAGQQNSEGSYNVMVGAGAGDSNTTGELNTFIGSYSGYKNTTGNQNTFLGEQSGENNTIGAGNTYLGIRAGRNNITGSDNVFIGKSAGANESGSDKLYIANNNTTTPLIWGDFSTEELRINGTLKVTNLPVGDYHNVQWDASTKQFYYDISSQRYKENISELTDDFSKLLKLAPKTYTRPGKPERQEIGYIAEELDAAGLNKLVWYNEEGKPEGINYEKIILYTNENVKLLKQENEELKNTIIELIKRIELLENR